MTEHLYPYAAPRGALDILTLDGIIYGADLIQIELTGQHHHIGPLRVEAHGLDIGDVDLGGHMHLHSAAAGIEYGGHIGGYDGRYTGLGCGINGGMQGLEVIVEYHGVYRKVGLDPGGIAGLGYAAQVVKSEVD